jgi:hypothetical protein
VEKMDCDGAVEDEAGMERRFSGAGPKMLFGSLHGGVARRYRKRRREHLRASGKFLQRWA